jgi:alkylation response protein AidB-like acyl-CoA dehydrogenase
MNFALNDEQLAIQASIDGFVRDACPTEQVRRIFDSEEGYDAALWGELCRLGAAAVALPAEYGGMGLELFDLALVAETLGAGAMPGPFLGHVLASLAIAWCGDDEQRARWLPRLASGELLATAALAEEGGRWQPGEWSMEPGDRLNGTKLFVPYAPQSQLLVVGLRGGLLAMVDPSPASVRCIPVDAVDRTRRVSSVEFQASPAELLRRSTPELSRRLRDAALVLLAADAFGGASRCVRMATEYANTREQYGSKIGEFQGLKYQIVDTACAVEPSRGLYWGAAHAFTHDPRESERLAALAKAHLTDVYVQAARNMIEVHGGIGYTWEFHAHIYLKRAMFDYAFLGGADLHRRRAIELAGWDRGRS